MQKNIFKSGVILFSSLMVGGIVATSSTAVKANADKINYENEYSNINDEENLSLQNYVDDYFNEDNVETNEDVSNYLNYLSQTDEFNNYCEQNNISFNNRTSRGVVGASLKAIKTLGWVLRIGGKGLSVAVKPLSKDKAKLISHYSRQTAWAIEKLDSAKQTALVALLHKAGVPGKVADTIASIVWTLI